ncbi:hypothetical protein Patl1_20459 [Pistacia atlantica]|uniref:Uncharacterized protein n=1 Tax=Pistacia atlantica TaxID=434234 RepID=A0ACC1BKY5_9ROSI|nr:hypothetical protein Patl1_20459 [Pistacia atlantica]
MTSRFLLSPPLRTPHPHAYVKVPIHLQPSLDASFHLRQPIAAPLHELSPKANRIVIIHDALMASVVQDAASILNAETYAFHGIYAFTHEDIIKSSAIKEAVRRLMVSEEGDGMRRRANELRECMQKSVAKGGVASLELESFIAQITRQIWDSN